MGLDKNQSRAATTFGSSLAIIAGAGSGKTQTMKERAAEAFIERTVDVLLEDGGVLKAHPKIVDSIGEILAITFTEAAAAELKDRIKGALRMSADPAIRSQALLVDDAWISTIHGMCSRLLKENAFTLGVDPMFQIVQESVSRVLLQQAIDEAVADSPTAPKLLEEYGTNDDDKTSLKGMVRSLIAAAVRSPKLFRSFVLPPDGDVRQILEVLCYVLRNDPKEHAKQLQAQTGVRYSPAGLQLTNDAAVLDVVEALLASGKPISPNEALAALRPLKTVGDEKKDSKNPSPQLVLPGAWAALGPMDRQTAALLCVQSLGLMVTNADVRELIRLSSDAYRRFQEKKTQLGVMDNDDLLLAAYHALQDSRIRGLYADKFKLVIVDEFQDTNQLQLDIIRNFTGPDDERLCVVGDRMQSIYRFQGADVSVCNGHLETSSKDVMRIDTNYRSHADVLSFVDLAFGDMGVPYLKLYPTKEETRKKPGTPYDENIEGPRITVFEIQQQSSKWILSDSRSLAAEAIAMRFKQMHDPTGDGTAHRSYGDMVILLNKTTHADVYARALRQHGIPCAVVKGSILKDSAEAAALVSVLKVLADIDNTEHVFRVLSGPLFGLTDKDLIDLAHSRTHRSTRDLSQQLRAYVAARQTGKPTEPALEGLSQRARQAVRVLGDGIVDVGTKPVSDVVNRILVLSGMLERLPGPEGRAVGANLLKTVRLLKGFEDGGSSGPNQLAAQLSAHLASASEAPGNLCSSNDDFVRIMTIHASKGLAFPIVAVGELQATVSSQKLMMASSRGTTFLSLNGGASFDVGEEKCVLSNWGTPSPAMLDDDADMDDEKFLTALQVAVSAGCPALCRTAIARYVESQERAEMERKIYVALTRAQEALIVTAVGNITIKEVRTALDQEPYKTLVAERGLDLKADRGSQCYLLNVNGLTSKMVGSLREIQRKRPEVLRAGWEYHTVTPMWWKAWRDFGAVPPVLQGREDAAENADGYDMRLVGAAAAPDEGAMDAAGSATGGAKSAAAGADSGDDETANTGFLMYSDAELPWPTRVRYSNNWSLGIMSASSIKEAGHTTAAAADDHPTNTAEPEPVVCQPDPSAEEGFTDEGDPVDEAFPKVDATARGLAFHSSGEWAARHWKPGQPLRKPPAQRISAICRFNGLGYEDEAAVDTMLDGWFASGTARMMAAKAHLVPEAPFFVRLTDTAAVTPIDLNGFIDLLAYDSETGEASVVDYKTGTSLRTPADRHAAYEVQALTYAYALLQQGFASVTLRFVFVEQPDATGELPVEVFPAEGCAYTSVGDVREALLARIDRIVIDREG